jgi:hypothetical protein
VIDLFDKTIHYWFAVIGAAVYVYMAQKDVPFLPRISRVIGAGLIGVSTGDEIAETFGTAEKITTVAVIALGWLVLDAGATLIRHHKSFLDLLRKMKGGE